MSRHIRDFRQPMATVSGILLGFILNFASTWASKAGSNTKINEKYIAFAFVICVILMLIVLYRTLNYNYPEQKVDKYYQKTLVLLIVGVSVCFIAILLAMIQSFIFHRQ